MKRYVLLVGGTGARLADALLCAAGAGAFPAEKIDVLLADTDHRGVRSAALVSAKMADYACVHQAMGEKDGPFRTEVAFSSWPRILPEDASTLAELTRGETDALLCQALFDKDAASLDLHEGFHGRRALGMVTYAGLLDQADRDHEDALSCLVDDMVQAVNEGEEVRVVLAGSICGGTGAAGIESLTRYILKRTDHQVNLGAVLLAACDDEQDAAQAHEALAAYANTDLLDTVCLLGLPQACRSTAPAEYAHLTDWLGVYCMDVLLHRPVWFKGVFTVKAPEGPLSWEIFGKAAQRYRLCYGGLTKFAAAWVSGLSRKIEKRLRKPRFLRDELLGWYAHFFRRMQADREEQLALIEPLSRLMNVYLIWLGGVCKSLPIDLRNASALSSARDEAENHYRDLIDLSSRLTVMDDDAKRGELYEDNLVYRSKNSSEAAEAEAALKRIAAARQELARRTGVQTALNRKMGGASAMAMLEEALDAARKESGDMRDRYDEAVRRIDHAERIAEEKDQYRITDARTKLKRMERHRLLLDSRLERIDRDVERANEENLRFDKPALTPAPAENEMFPPDLADFLLHPDRLNKKAVEARYARMVCPGETLTLKNTKKAVRRAPVRRDAPLMSLVKAIFENAMKEV